MSSNPQSEIRTPSVRGGRRVLLERDGVAVALVDDIEVRLERRVGLGREEQLLLAGLAEEELAAEDERAPVLRDGRVRLVLAQSHVGGRGHVRVVEREAFGERDLD